MNYDYNEALKNEKDLDLEVDQLRESLENLKDFLTAKSTISLEYRQILLE